ncbi:MAG: tetratricopeptide repeat protein [Planctomycetaceae bacterium]|nr:tetratricopeptide repeat protein [Planctomycetaceae bacterium]
MTRRLYKEQSAKRKVILSLRFALCALRFFVSYFVIFAVHLPATADDVLQIAPEPIPLSGKNYYAAKQSCSACHEKEFRLWYGSKHQLAMGAVSPETVQADFNDVLFVHAGFDDLARLSGDELKTVVQEAGLPLLAQGLADAKSDVLSKLNAVLPQEKKAELQRLLANHPLSSATFDPESIRKTASATPFLNVCPIRPCDVQDVHQRVVDLLHRLAAEGKINIDFGQKYRFFRKNDRFMVECDNASGKDETFEIKYTMGIRPLQQYLVEFPDGRIQCLPVAWDVSQKRWFHLYPKERILSGDLLHWTKPVQNWNYACAGCHTTDLQKNYDVETNRYHTKWSEMSVGCQSCHGPCGRHVERMSIPNLLKTSDRSEDLGLPLLSEMSSREEIGMCAPCHAHRRVLKEGTQPPGSHFFDHYVPSLIDGNLFYADGQILEESYEYTSFMQSRMSEKGVRCSTCHDPHSAKLTHEGNALCTQCHDKTFDSPAHHHHADATKPGTLCIECHMPVTTYMIVDPRHDHNIKIPDPELTIALGIPNACSQCHRDEAKGETPGRALQQVRKWHASGDGNSSQRDHSQHDHVAFAITAGRNGDPDAAEKLLLVANQTNTDKLRPIVRASTVSLLGRCQTPDVLPEIMAACRNALKDNDPNVRLAAVPAFENLPPETRWAELSPLLGDPVRAVRCETARVLSSVSQKQFSADDKKRFDAALQEYIASLNASSDHPAAHLNLAVLWENLATPQLIEAQQSETQTSQQATVETVRRLTQPSLLAYRQAIKIDPQFIPAHVNLAMLHHLRSEPQETEAEFKRVIEIDPAHGETYYSLALLYAEQRRFAESETMFAQALQHIKTGNARMFYNYGVLLLQTGKIEEAERQLINAWQNDKTSIDVLNALVNVSIQKKEYDKALGRLQLIMKLDPENPVWQRQFQEVMRLRSIHHEGDKRAGIREQE